MRCEGYAKYRFKSIFNKKTWKNSEMASYKTLYIRVTLLFLHFNIISLLLVNVCIFLSDSSLYRLELYIEQTALEERQNAS